MTATLTEQRTPTSLYRYYDSNGALIYVGITKQGMGRNLQHNGNAEWWQYVARQEVEHLPDRASALAAEKALIQQHEPPFNRQHNPNHAVGRGLYLLAQMEPARKEAAYARYLMLPKRSPKKSGRWMPLNGPHPYCGGLVFVVLPEHNELAEFLTIRRKAGAVIHEAKGGNPTADLSRIERKGGLTAIQCDDASGVSKDVTNPRALVHWHPSQPVPWLIHIWLHNASGPVIG